MCILCVLKSQAAAAAASSGDYYDEQETADHGLQEQTQGFYLLVPTENGGRVLVRVGQTLESHMAGTSAVDSSSQSGSAMSGIMNEGNTCYANSFLQVLSHSQSFARLVLSERMVEGENSGFPVITQLRMILKKMADNEIVLSTAVLRRSVNERFCQGEQMDAHEFGIQLLDHVREEATKNRVWERYSSLFHLKSKQSRQCFGCLQTRNEVVESSYITIGPVTRDGQTVAELIEKTIEGRRLEGDHMLPCETCKSKKIGQEFVRFLQVPEFLQIHIHRLSPDPLSRSVVLTNRTVSINHHIWICSEDAGHAPITTLYTLYAVIVRRGSHAQYGHYITFARNSFYDPPEGDASNLNSRDAQRSVDNDQYSVWNYLNDTEIGQVPWHQLEVMLSKQSDFSPYLLFYKKRQYQPSSD